MFVSMGLVSFHFISIFVFRGLVRKRLQKGQHSLPLFKAIVVLILYSKKLFSFGIPILLLTH